MIFDISAFIPQVIGLFVFGIIFAYIVYRMDGRHEGYTSLLVVIGVVATVGSVGPTIGWPNVCILAAAFAASGAPMIVGDVIRSIQRRERAERLYRENLNKLAERGIKGGRDESPPAGE